MWYVCSLTTFELFITRNVPNNILNLENLALLFLDVSLLFRERYILYKDTKFETNYFIIFQTIRI